MKMLIAAVMIFIVLTGVSLGYYYFLNSTVEKMTEKIDEIHSYMMESNYEKAIDSFRFLKKYWEKSEIIIQLETEHNELDIINEQFAVMTSHFDHMEFDVFYETLYKLKYFLKHISEKKQFNFKTIL